MTIERLEYQYLDQSSSVKSILLNQKIFDYNLKLSKLSKSNVCQVFEETTNYINIRITYSPNETVSVVELRFKLKIKIKIKIKVQFFERFFEDFTKFDRVLLHIRKDFPVSDLWDKCL